MCCCINSANAGRAARFLGEHLELRDDSEYGGLSTRSTDSGYGGLSTRSTDSGYGGLSTRSTDSGYGGSSTRSTDSGYGGLLTRSTDSGFGGLSTAATSTCFPSHLIERYQKMSMPPLAEGKLRYARTGLPRTVDFVVYMCRTLPEPDRDELRGR